MDITVVARILVVPLSITEAGQRVRLDVPVPPNLAAIAAIRVMELPGNKPFRTDVRYHGSGAPGQQSEAFVKSLTKEYLAESPDYFVADADGTDKVYYAQAVRLGIPQFGYAGGVGGMLSPKVVSITNGTVTENYYLWESQQDNLDEIEFTVTQPSGA